MEPTRRWIGQLTTVAGQTVNIANSEDMARSYANMVIVGHLSALTGGSSPTVTVSVEEAFPLSDGSQDWIQTGASTAASATGAVGIASYPLMGKGMQKRVKTTVTGTPATLTLDLWAVFYN